MITTEAGIYHDWFKDIYITLGNENNNIWFIRVLYKPISKFYLVGSYYNGIFKCKLLL